jgi:hypothetical protein
VIASACSQAEQSAGGQGLGMFIHCFEVSSNFSKTYELIGSTNLRFMQRSTDRRDCCIGDSGAITFKFWVQLSSRDTEILLKKQAWYINMESCEISKGIPGENRWLAIWTEKTIAFKYLV